MTIGHIPYQTGRVVCELSACKVGARFISNAGSLISLACMPSPCIQSADTGCNKALFRAFKTRSDTPKYGLILHSVRIGVESHDTSPTSAQSPHILMLQWTASDSGVWVKDGDKLSKLGDYMPRYFKMYINRTGAKHWGRISWYVYTLPTGVQSPHIMLYDQLAVNVWADAERSGGGETLLLWSRQVAEEKHRSDAGGHISVRNWSSTMPFLYCLYYTA